MATTEPHDAPCPTKHSDSIGRTDVRVYTNTEVEVDRLCANEDLQEQPICWICLDHSSQGNPLVQPCNCPRQAHPTCVARWQLQSAGTRKETHCEFCDQTLPDWKKTLTPQCGANAPAVMNVNFNERTFSFEVKPGVDGYKEFTDQIRRAFNLPADSELNITFTCDEPVAMPAEPALVEPAAPLTPPHSRSMLPPPPPLTPEPTVVPARIPSMTPPSPTTAQLLTLQGAGAYDAAVHCASVSAARRMSQSPSSQGGSPQSMSAIPMSNQFNLTGPSLRQGANGRVPPFMLPNTRQGVPQGILEDSRAAPSRRHGGSNMLQRASKAVRKFTGRRSDRE